MATARFNTTDPDIIGSFSALKRAAKRARAISIALGTPFYVMDKEGRMVDLNAPSRARKSSRKPSPKLKRSTGRRTKPRRA